MDPPLLYLATVIVLGIAAQWLAWRLRLPAILLLLAGGFAAGQWTAPEEVLGTDVLLAIVSLSVALILFEGGLSLQWSQLGEAAPTMLRLVTVGVAVTVVLTTLAARLTLGMNWSLAVVVGALFVVTGPTVIIPLLRQVRPDRRIDSIAKWEGIVNDPTGAILAVLAFETLVAGGMQEAAATVVVSVLKTVGLSVGLGVAAAFLLVQLLKRHRVPDYLESAVVLAVVIACFTGSNLLQPESGLATVTLLGIVLANQRSVVVHHVMKFKENLRVLLISSLFILLAARTRVGEVLELGGPGLLFLAALVMLIRPLSTLAATVGSPLNRRERCFLAWLAPRGIVAASVSSVFSLELARLAEDGAVSPAVARQAELLVPVTFLTIIGTVTIYGLSAAPLARRLKIADPNPQGILFAGANPLVQEIARVLYEEDYEVLLVDTNDRYIQEARMAGLPTAHESILSDAIRDRGDLAGIGRLLAMTPNDGVNALATLHFVEAFGRANVYQLAPEVRRHEPASAHLHGRFLFAPETTYMNLFERLTHEASVKTTPLTREFDYEAFRTYYGSTALPLFVIDPWGHLTVCTADEVIDPQPGETLVSLVDRREQQETVDKLTDRPAETTDSRPRTS